jgi:hypothetical protein
MLRYNTRPRSSLVVNAELSGLTYNDNDTKNPNNQQGKSPCATTHLGLQR